MPVGDGEAVRTSRAMRSVASTGVGTEGGYAAVAAPRRPLGPLPSCIDRVEYGGYVLYKYKKCTTAQYG